jgi:hypothetical protein
MAIAAIACLTAASAAAPPAGADLLTKTPPLATRWTAQVSPTAPLPEYPRPQLVRSDWQSLNGQWQFGSAAPGEAPPFGRDLPETILVPFPTQSALSGIMRNQPSSWYRRSFTVPPEWRNRRVVLNFGAVTFSATVYVNGMQVGAHRGSYDGFSIDITDVLKPLTTDSNELVIRVDDPMLDGGQPLGKQRPEPSGVFYTASTGIWQSVWMEPVAAAHVTRLDQRPDVEGNQLIVTPQVAGPAGTTVDLTASDDTGVVGQASGAPGTPISVPVPNAKLWSPDHPFLYDLSVDVRLNGVVVDHVQSYFGMRSIALRSVGGVVRPVLNGQFVFQSGVLDQGYWPDGIYTAPTDEALRSDIELEKQLGFNMVRKHAKVEPDRWYYWADKLGILVWQDMPSMPLYRKPAQADKTEFEQELQAMVEQHASHPSIVTWVPFNEGWGQYDVDRITNLVQQLDPSRLVDGQSGGANCCLALEPTGGSFRDVHMYNGPDAAPPDSRASVVGEFGGISSRPVGHEWPGFATPTPTNFSLAADQGLLTRQWDALAQEMRIPGLSGATFTQITDVEREFDGLVTYDRAVPKVGVDVMASLNQALIAASQTDAGLSAVAPALPPGTIAHWGFNEGRGRVARDDLGRRPLKLGRGVTWTTGVNGSRALTFDGRGGTAVSKGPVIDTRGSFTVSAWLMTGTRGQTATAIAQEGPHPGFELGHQSYDARPDLGLLYALYYGIAPPRQAPNRWTFNVPFEGVNSGYGDIGLRPSPGRWQFITGVVDRTNRTASLFIDGTPIEHRIVDRLWQATGPFLVGAAKRGRRVRTFRGAVDDVRVFNRALSAGEVAALYGASAVAPVGGTSP